MSVDPVIAASARQHRIADEDMLHAFRNPVRDFDLGDGLTMLIGPARDATLLEVGVKDEPDGPVIIHAMKARAKFLRWKGDQ
jgi:hypothetical protein